MNTIFETETEIGVVPGHLLQVAGVGGGLCSIWVHTTASSAGSLGILRIEHHCYARNGESPIEQPWIKPDLAIEPAIGTREEQTEIARRAHEEYVQHAIAELPEQCLEPALV